MISPVGTDRTGGIYFRQRLGGMTGMSDSVNGPARFRLFAPVFPLFEHGRPDHGLTARRADRAVLIELRRFLVCAVERRAFLAGANPARQLSLQPVSSQSGLWR